MSLRRFFTALAQTPLSTERETVAHMVVIFCSLSFGVFPTSVLHSLFVNLKTRQCHTETRLPWAEFTNCLCIEKRDNVTFSLYQTSFLQLQTL